MFWWEKIQKLVENQIEKHDNEVIDFILLH